MVTTTQIRLNAPPDERALSLRGFLSEALARGRLYDWQVTHAAHVAASLHRDGAGHLALAAMAQAVKVGANVHVNNGRAGIPSENLIPMAEELTSRLRHEDTDFSAAFIHYAGGAFLKNSRPANTRERLGRFANSVFGGTPPLQVPDLPKDVKFEDKFWSHPAFKARLSGRSSVAPALSGPDPLNV